MHYIKTFLGLPSGAVNKNPPANERVKDAIPGSRDFHMPWNN